MNKGSQYNYENSSINALDLSVKRESTASKSMGFLQRKRMSLFKIVFVFVLFAPVCLTVQQALQLDQLKTDLLSLLEVKEQPTVSRSRYQVPRYVIDLYRKQAFIDGFTKDGTSPGTTIRTFFRGR